MKRPIKSRLSTADCLRLSTGFQRVLLAALLAGAIGACSGLQTESVYPEKSGSNTYDPTGSNKEKDSVFGKGGFTLFGGSKKKEGGEGGVGIGVNSFLWRASLDTVAFMPLSSADPFGGVIISDWHSPPDSANERFKVTVYILDRALRADGVKVALFRQVRRGDAWVDEPASLETAINLENAILARARQLRVAAAGL
jgi:Domain of unknown function (DUF3576)